MTLEVPGGPFGSFEDFRDCCDFGSASATKKARTPCDFWGVLGASNPLFECCVFGVFLSARFFDFFVIWGARGSILAVIWTAFWEPWTSEKTAETVYLSSISEVWPLPDTVFLQVLIVGAF